MVAASEKAATTTHDRQRDDRADLGGARLVAGITARSTEGQRIGETDQAGKVTTFSYDGSGRLVKVTDTLNQVTSYAYDQVGNRISVTDAAGRTTSFAYDKLGRETKRTLP
jgi:YD repeat-containing protein